MKKIIILLILNILIINVNAAENPAYKYCVEMGYDFKIQENQFGEEGICVLPNGNNVNSWDFLKGKIGEEYSYCKKKDLEIVHIKDSDKCASIYSNDCSVCLMANGSAVEPTKLMNLDFNAFYCGDYMCTKGENIKNCPKDCKNEEENYGWLTITILLITLITVLVIRYIKKPKDM
tara:strand:+ start:321 stop:848 length:528 start_codon:yes stop_codon:yes gene_type:complete